MLYQLLIFSTMETKTKQILVALKIISWIIFFGLCVQTGAIIFTFIYSFFNPLVSQNLYSGLDLSHLYAKEVSSYSFVVCSLILLSGLKAYIFFLVVKIFLMLNFKNPFKLEVAIFFERISYFAFAVWLLSEVSSAYSRGLINSGMEISELNLQKYLGGGSEFFFLGMIVFIISQVFKRGIELQSENDLTV